MTDVPFDVEAEHLEDHSIVRVSGELDIATAPATRPALDDAFTRRPGSLVVDLSQVTFMDSSGLRVVLSTRSCCEKAGIRLRLVPGPAPVMRVFEVSGVAELFDWDR